MIRARIITTRSGCLQIIIYVHKQIWWYLRVQFIYTNKVFESSPLTRRQVVPLGSSFLGNCQGWSSFEVHLMIENPSASNCKQGLAEPQALALQQISVSLLGRWVLLQGYHYWNCPVQVVQRQLQGPCVPLASQPCSKTEPPCLAGYPACFFRCSPDSAATFCLHLATCQQSLHQHGISARRQLAYRQFLESTFWKSDAAELLGDRRKTGSLSHLVHEAWWNQLHTCDDTCSSISAVNQTSGVL